jgi:hypothetical protein
MTKRLKRLLLTATSILTTLIVCNGIASANAPLRRSLDPNEDARRHRIGMAAVGIYPEIYPVPDKATMQVERLTRDDSLIGNKLRESYVDVHRQIREEIERQWAGFVNEFLVEETIIGDPDLKGQICFTVPDAIPIIGGESVCLGAAATMPARLWMSNPKVEYVKFKSEGPTALTHPPYMVQLQRTGDPAANQISFRAGDVLEVAFSAKTHGYVGPLSLGTLGSNPLNVVMEIRFGFETPVGLFPPRVVPRSQFKMWMGEDENAQWGNPQVELALTPLQRLAAEAYLFRGSSLALQKVINGLVQGKVNDLWGPRARTILQSLEDRSYDGLTRMVRELPIEDPAKSLDARKVDIPFGAGPVQLTYRQLLEGLGGQLRLYSETLSATQTQVSTDYDPALNNFQGIAVAAVARFTPEGMGRRATGRVRYPRYQCDYVTLGSNALGYFTFARSVKPINENLIGRQCNAVIEPTQARVKAVLGASPARILGRGHTGLMLDETRDLGSVRGTGVVRFDSSIGAYVCDYETTAIPRKGLVQVGDQFVGIGEFPFARPGEAPSMVAVSFSKAGVRPIVTGEATLVDVGDAGPQSLADCPPSFTAGRGFLATWNLPGVRPITDEWCPMCTRGIRIEDWTKFLVPLEGVTNTQFTDVRRVSNVTVDRWQPANWLAFIPLILQAGGNPAVLNGMR